MKVCIGIEKEGNIVYVVTPFTINRRGGGNGGTRSAHGVIFISPTHTIRI
jgi:hypothetical protein